MGGVLFLLLMAAAVDSLATESGCTGNDGAGKLFWGIKTRLFVVVWWQLSFLVILSVSAKYAVVFKMKSREDVKLTGCNRPIRHLVPKHYKYATICNDFQNNQFHAKNVTLKLFQSHMIYRI